MALLPTTGRDADVSLLTRISWLDTENAGEVRAFLEQDAVKKYGGESHFFPSTYWLRELPDFDSVFDDGNLLLFAGDFSLVQKVMKEVASSDEPAVSSILFNRAKQRLRGIHTSSSSSLLAFNENDPSLNLPEPPTLKLSDHIFHVLSVRRPVDDVRLCIFSELLKVLNREAKLVICQNCTRPYERDKRQPKQLYCSARCNNLVSQRRKRQREKEGVTSFVSA